MATGVSVARRKWPWETWTAMATRLRDGQLWQQLGQCAPQHGYDAGHAGSGLGSGGGAAQSGPGHGARHAPVSQPVHYFNALGRLVLTTKADATGAATLSLPPGLPTGICLVHSGSSTARLAIE